MPDLPKYDGTKDPQEHVAAFDLVMNLYGQSGPINAKLFVTTLTEKAQEWFTSLPPDSIESHEQLMQNFTFHFASKRKQKRSATHLFTIRQRKNKTLKSFMWRFNNETLEVQDLRIDMMISILIHGLKKEAFASALARDPPADVDQLMALAQKYIDEEEMNAMKDEEWSVAADRRGDRDRVDKEGDRRTKPEKIREPAYQPKYQRLLETWRGKKYDEADREVGTVGEIGKEKGGNKERENAPVKGIIHTIAGGSAEHSKRSTKRWERESRSNKRKQIMNVAAEQEIVLGDRDAEERVRVDNDPMVIRMDIANYTIHKVLVDNESSANIILKEVLRKMGLENAILQLVRTPLVGFGGSEVESLGTIDLPISIGETRT
ncbi:uncharacterized protein LOC105156873 [Sesamum indicum]|uniref:Uncharacterized protein LOC105156873 n=1 Tax=Sesamum indicum TaxID=4182 RepID=A0A6I9SQE2_SESIN|nr:uncharacterized protein LOC105156873 [Sesamum indicum]